MIAKRLDSIIENLKKALNKELNNNNYENALRIINTTANILYSTNYYYRDDDLEDALKIVSEHLCHADDNYKSDKEKVIFYDGFGLNSRGLVQIYLKALCKIKKVVYVTYDRAYGAIPDVKRILEENDGEALFIKSHGNHIEMIDELVGIINSKTPEHFFFYSTPDAVVATTTMHAFEGKIKRYQINLTDHAFWLGAAPIDICVDFREYGASISRDYRRIPESKIVCVPYYPIINENEPFEGYPFEMKPSNRIVFSGGALYKTLGENNKYYEIVDYILRNYQDVIFWYAGNGDSRELDKIIDRYPNRAYHTGERKDLYQVIKKSYLYLSTYPLCGGLMFQYAAKAGRIPITLKNGDVTEGFLVNQSSLGIEFDSLEDLYREIDRLLLDTCYHEEKEKLVRKAVIRSDRFDSLVKELVDGEYESLQHITYKLVDTVAFRRVYLKEMTTTKLYELIATRRNAMLLKSMPEVFLCGMFIKLTKRIRNSLKNQGGFQ